MMKKIDKIDTPHKDITGVILESISDGVFSVDHDWKILSFNHAAEEITGVSREEAIGKHCWEVFRANMCETDCALKKTMEQEKSFVSSSTYIVNADRKQIPVTVSTSLLQDKKGEILGGVEVFRDHSLVEELRKEISAKFKMCDMVSNNLQMKKIFNILPQIAESDSTVLIEGETGTGKELMARAIHNLSLRENKPFIAINCGALPDSLLESELFGYKAGAFTNALKDKPGHFSRANGGTIFLDEIGDTSPAFQVRLLRVLEEKEFIPLGGITKEKTDIRIITATNKDLLQLVAQEKFRQDLFYRVNVVRLELLPLRHRMEDIPFLIQHFIAKLNRIQGKQVSSVNHEALELIMNHDFPGNIRELENIIEHSFVLCSKGNINVQHLPSNFSFESKAKSLDEKTGDHIKTIEASIIKEALKKNHYNRKAAAKSLGMHKSTLFRKINKFNIKLPKTDGRSRLV